jgi:hypothetical protein
VKFIATSSGVASITALSGGTSIAAANAVKIQVGAAAVGAVALQANPTTLPSAGGTTDLTATVSDTSGNVLPGVPVSFSIDTTGTAASGAGSFTASVVTSDANGRATTQLTTNRTTTVAATAGIATTSGGTGGTGTTTTAQTAKVTINVNSTATITVGTIAPATPSVNQAVTVPLTYGTTGSPITRVTVNWGDGTTSSVPGQPAVVTHTYSQPGTFGVQITGTDAFGDPANTGTSITVTSSRPTVTITPPSAPKANVAASFTIAAAVPAGSTASIASVAISWGDGTSTTVPGNITSASHTYTAANSYTVTVTATDTNSQQGTASTVVSVVP